MKLCENVSPVNNVGLSRLRRRERRASARKVAAVKAIAVNDTAEESESNEEAVEVKTDEVIEVKAEEVVKVKAEEAVQNVVSDVSAEAAEEVVDVQVGNSTSQEGSENPVQMNKVGNGTNPDTVTSEKLDETLVVEKAPQVAIVHAEVSFGNSLNFR